MRVLSAYAVIGGDPPPLRRRAGHTCHPERSRPVIGGDPPPPRRREEPRPVMQAVADVIGGDPPPLRGRFIEAVSRSVLGVIWKATTD